MIRRSAALLLGASLLVGCSRDESSGGSSSSSSVAPVGSSAAPSALSDKPPALLYLPDGGDRALEPGRRPELLPGPGLTAPRACPSEMVNVGGRFCIDRYESSPRGRCDALQAVAVLRAESTQGAP